MALFIREEIMGSYILITVSIIVLMLTYNLYASLIRKRNNVNSALSSIDIQLKLRFDLIPNILTIANEFMIHERTLLTKITELRSLSANSYDKSNSDEVSQHLNIVNELDAKMGQFKITMENYPILKSDSTMCIAMNTYNEVEEQIAAARRFYNSSVTELNNSVQIFPGSIFSKLMHIPTMPFYAADEASKAPINAKQFFTRN